jgi:Histidine kinase-, DNA gyrase B-, and HSP90-like ATPase
MDDTRTLTRQDQASKARNLHFDVSTGLKRVLGRELITADEVAIFEMVKNSFDAQADEVYIYFGEDQIIVGDNGSGMSYADLQDKWLFVAYSTKRETNPVKDFRDVVAERGRYAGSKGIGRFSSDRLGKEIRLQTRPDDSTETVHKLTIDWDRFERNDKDHFESVPVVYTEARNFELPPELRRFGARLSRGTIIEVRGLRNEWNRARILSLKSSLAKLINPFGDEADGFNIRILAPAEIEEDNRFTADAARSGGKPFSKDIVNGRVGNFIFSELKGKTTSVNVSIEDGKLCTTLTDRGELIYKIREPNPYPLLDGSGFRCEIYYLNHSAKTTFARRIGLQSVQFGSVFLFRNGFRVYPIGDERND